MPKKDTKIWNELGPYLNLGWQLVITIILMIFLGKWIDEKFETSPTFIVIFSILGVFAGMYNFLKVAMKSSKKKKQKK